MILSAFEALAWTTQLLFQNGPTPATFSFFRSFQTNNTIFTTNQCEKCPFSMRRHDLNPQPFEHESSPITTRPGLLPSHVSATVFLSFL